MVKTRVVLPVLVAAAAAALAIAGCGGGGDSSADPAVLAAPGTLVFAEGNLRPAGEQASNVDALAQAIGGIDNLGEFAVEELESSASDDGEPVDFAKEIEPWLGERAGVAFEDLEDDGDLSEPTIAIETTDAGATQKFIDDQAAQSDDPYRNGTYGGIGFKVGGSEGNAIGIVDDFLVIADGERSFGTAVDAAQGESLADEAGFQDAIALASDGSLLDVYADVGGLIDASDDEIDPQARKALRNAGIDPSEATAVASAIPGSDRIQIDLSSDLGGEEAPSGDVSELLGSLPEDSFAAFAVSGFGEQLKEAIDELDKTGIPDSVPPNQLKSTLKAMGIDLEKIAGSLDDAGVFVRGSSESSLGGAMVLTSDSDEAAKSVANLGVLLRNTGTPGVTAVNGNGASGFSVRSEDLGEKPLVVVAKESRVAIGYGLPAAFEGLDAAEGATLSGTGAFREAVSALGSTPISAFVDGPAALLLAESMVSPGEEEFEDARPYLKKVSYVGIGSGSGSDGDVATAKLIVGVEK